MIQFPLFWCGLGGTMSFSLDATLRNGPAIDMTAITTARFRLQQGTDAATYLDGTVATSPPATTTKARLVHVLGPSSFTEAGTWRMWGEFSLDGGTSWYPTTESSVTVTS